MNLVIIGMGESSRLKSEESKIPRHMIKINGENIIERIIRIARQNGVKKVFCVVNEYESELKKYLSTHSFGIPINLIIRTTQSSMHSLFALAKFLLDSPFCLTTIDSIFDEKEFSDFIDYSILQADADGTLAITRYIDDEKPLCVALDEEDTIVKFSDSKEGYGWATGGIFYFSPKILDEIQFALETNISKFRNFLRLLISRGYLLKGFSFSKIIDVDHI